MQFWKIPGFAAAVIKDGQIISCDGVGVRNITDRKAVTKDTRFAVASCTKSMTSALIAMLVDDGLLDYDVPIREYIPHFRLNDPIASFQVTLRDLLCHRSGLGGHDGMWPAKISRAEFTRRLQYLKPNVPFRAKAQYSNIMYILIGHVAECVTGKSWEQLMKERIFLPLNMTESSCYTKDLYAASNHAEPYAIQNGKLYQLKPWNIDLAGPAASVNSTAGDMAKWLAMQINGGSVNGKRLIQPATFKEMHQPQSVLEDATGAVPGFASCHCYGFGWRIGQYRGFEVQKHRGEIEGFSSMQAYLPEQKLGVVLLTNLHAFCGPFLYTILYTAFDKLLGLPKINWAEKFHPLTQRNKFPTELAKCDLLPDSPAADTKLSHNPKAYTGVFQNEGYGKIHITFLNDLFYLQFQDAENLPMQHYHYETFKVNGIKEDTIIYSLPLTFLTNPQTGKVDGFLLRLEPSVNDILFKKLNI